MVNLPVKYEVAEMLAAANGEIEEQQKYGLHPNAAAYAKDMMKRYAQFHPACALEIIALARHGSEPADAALCELWREYATENKAHVTLQAYMIERNKREFERKKTGQARRALNSVIPVRMVQPNGVCMMPVLRACAIQSSVHTQNCRSSPRCWFNISLATNVDTLKR